MIDFSPELQTLLTVVTATETSSPNKEILLISKFFPSNFYLLPKRLVWPVIGRHLLDKLGPKRPAYLRFKVYFPILIKYACL
jgi:hypothetical protein